MSVKRVEKGHCRIRVLADKSQPVSATSRTNELVRPWIEANGASIVDDVSRRIGFVL